MSNIDPFDLQRFVNAQRDVYPQALSEIKNGNKTSHWMWFIFPQIKGLGSSSASVLYSINSVNEAKAFLGHPILGPRIRECCSGVFDLNGVSVEHIFGDIDAIKLRSSMTLFDHIAPEDVFSDVLRKYYSGQKDLKTLAIIATMSST
jgi:uncharacterized protein (DUF1810 family)